MLSPAARLSAVRQSDTLTIRALPGTGSPERYALNHFSKRCVITIGVVTLAGITTVAAAALSSVNPQAKAVLVGSGAAALLATCCGLLCHVLGVKFNRSDEAAQPLLCHAVQIQMTQTEAPKAHPAQAVANERRGQESLNPLQQSFDELLHDAPPYSKNMQELSAGPMQIALEEAIRGRQYA